MASIMSTDRDALAPLENIYQIQDKENVLNDPIDKMHCKVDAESKRPTADEAPDAPKMILIALFVKLVNLLRLNSFNTHPDTRLRLTVVEPPKNKPDNVITRYRPQPKKSRWEPRLRPYMRTRKGGRYQNNLHQLWRQFC